MRYTLTEQRAIALGAARAKMRHMGIVPEKASAHDAMKVLDDLYRTDKTLIASQWYERATADDASDRQMILFVREWRAWKRQQHRGFDVSVNSCTPESPASLYR